MAATKFSKTATDGEGIPAAAPAAAAAAAAEDVRTDSPAQQPKAKRRNDDIHQMRAAWDEFRRRVLSFDVQQQQIANNFVFSFVEGAVVKAVREGHWILLDEVNLAPAETLEALSGLLESGSLTLTEKGGIEVVQPHPNFRIFACMNPPGDIGKQVLTLFSFFVHAQGWGSATTTIVSLCVVHSCCVCRHFSPYVLCVS